MQGNRLGAFDQVSDDALLAAVAQGDREKFAMLMQRHLPAALALASRMSGRPEDAEEIAQEAFLKVWVHAARWKTDGQARFATWLHRVVFNLSIDRRRLKPFVELKEEDDTADTGPDGAEMFERGEAERVLRIGLALLPDRQRAAVSLCYLGETSMAEAAEIMGLSVSAVESLLVRGRRALKAHFQAQGLLSLGDIL